VVEIHATAPQFIGVFVFCKIYRAVKLARKLSIHSQHVKLALRPVFGLGFLKPFLFENGKRFFRMGLELEYVPLVRRFVEPTPDAVHRTANMDRAQGNRKLPLGYRITVVHLKPCISKVRYKPRLLARAGIEKTKHSTGPVGGTALSEIVPYFSVAWPSGL